LDDIVKLIFLFIMYIVAIILGYFLSKNKKFDFLKSRDGRFGSIDGLRGYLAISIFAHHFMLTWYWKNTGHWYRPQELYFQNIGIVGVMLFFMITGFLFTLKLDSIKSKFDWIKLYKSRFFRIYPLFLFIIILISLVIFLQPQFQKNIDFSKLIEQYSQWIVFHGGNIHTHNHTPLIIAGVDWTLKYEWLFYLSLPFISILFLLNRWIVATILMFGIYIFFDDLKFYRFTTIHLVFFIIGIISAKIYEKSYKFKSFIEHRLISIVALTLLIYALSYKNIYDIMPIFLISIFFILISMGNSLFGLLKTDASILLGEISYSIYLIHGFIIYLTFTIFKFIDLKTISSVEHTYMLPILIPVVILSSTLTYLYIEKPAITFGKKSIRK